MLSRSYLVLLIALTSLSSLARAQGTGSFTSPGPQGEPGDYATSLTFQYGQQQTFTWTVDLPGVRLALWQQGNASGIQYTGTEDVLDYNVTQEFFIWDGIPSQILNDGHTFFLQMYDAAAAVGSASLIATSEYFNITDPIASSSSVVTAQVGAATSSSASSSTASSASATSSSTKTASTTTTDQASSSSTSESGPASATPTPTPKSSDALAIGLGTGLGCAFLLAILAAAFFFGRYKTNQSGEYAHGRTQDSQAGQEPHLAKEAYSTQEVYSGHEPNPSHELHGQSGGFIQSQEKWSHTVTPTRSELS